MCDVPHPSRSLRLGGLGSASVSHEGSDLFFGFRPDAATGTKALDKSAIARRKDAKTMLSDILGSEELLNFG
jgi:hypothetical protein